VCGKALSCVGNSLGISESVHMCQAPCHVGECPPCTNEVKFSCRCGSNSQVSTCSKETAASIGEFKCKRVCKEIRSCGKHQCGIACCTKSEEAHRCKLTCNKKLQCGLHTCTVGTLTRLLSMMPKLIEFFRKQMPCHKGHCYSCLQANFDEVACACGETRLYPPIPCGASLPRCPFPCSRFVIIPTFIEGHFPLNYNKKKSNPNLFTSQHSCSHPPAHSCHMDESCPSCSVLMLKPCACWRKMQVQTTCSKPFSNCGRPCEKSLPCGHHCLRICHDGDCEGGPFFEPSFFFFFGPEKNLNFSLYFLL